MKSQTVSELKQDVLTLLSDRDDGLTLSNDKSPARMFSDNDLLDALNMSCRVYVNKTEKTRSERVVTPTNGIARIPMDFMRLKDVLVTDSNPYVFNWLADYMVITYQFTDGMDLDTRTKFVDPTEYVYGTNDYMGWARAGEVWFIDGVGYRDVAVWAGDNQGTGYESVLVDISAMRSLYDEISTIKIDCRSFWYVTVGLNKVVLAVDLYRGGTMEVHDNYLWTNPTATESKSLGFTTKAVTLKSKDPSTNGERVCVMNYNIKTGAGFVDINDTTAY